MDLRFKDRGIVEIDDAKIIFRNLSGAPSKYNREGDRNFAVLIPNQDIADALMADVNEYGTGWNVKIKPPREEGDSPYMYLPVKVRFNSRGPAVYLQSGKARVRLDEETIGQLDDIDIASVDLDIRPYDDVMNGNPFRAAYLQSMLVVQNVDRFMDRFANEEYPED